MKNDIFISYSRRDSAIVDEFVQLMEDEGSHVWIDRDGIESGDAFKKVIVRAIKESTLVVFFSSASSNESEWTAKEISIAVHHAKPIIPIKIDNTVYNDEVEFDLVNLDYIDYTDAATHEVMKAKLLRTLRSKLPKRSDEVCEAQDATPPAESAQTVVDDDEPVADVKPQYVTPMPKPYEKPVQPEPYKEPVQSEPYKEPTQPEEKTFFQKAWPWGLAFLVFEIMYVIIVSRANHRGLYLGQGIPYGIVVSWPFILCFAVFLWLIRRFSKKYKALPWVIAGFSALVFLLYVLIKYRYLLGL